MEGEDKLLVRSHYRVCREYCSPEESQKMQQRSQQQRVLQSDVNTEWIYEVKPLLDIIVQYIALDLNRDEKKLPKNWSKLPSDVKDRFRPASKAIVGCRIHPCGVVPMDVDPSGQWRCDAWKLPGGCLRDLKAFGMTQRVRRWCCSGCDFDLCDKCVRHHARISATRKTRPANATNLTVGIFTVPAYRSALQRPVPHIFSVPLLRQAKQVYSFLEVAAPIKSLDEVGSLGYIIYSRYMLFVYIMRDHLKKSRATLIPPVDVEVIWFTHMLQSDKYAKFALKYGLTGVSHPWTLLITDKARDQSRAKASELWAAFCPSEPFEASTTKRANWRSSEPETELLISTQEVRLDRTWFGELRINVKSAAFLHRSLLGYQRFLYLTAKYPKTLQRIGFSPSPPIDLFWHTHLLQPDAYTHDSVRLIFNVHHHRLLTNEQQRTVQMYLESSLENSIWKSEFDESYAVYIQHLPSRVTVLHKCPMVFLVADGTDWRCDNASTLHVCARGLLEFGKAAGVDRWCCEYSLIVAF